MRPVPLLVWPSLGPLPSLRRGLIGGPRPPSLNGDQKLPANAQEGRAFVWLKRRHLLIVFLNCFTVVHTVFLLSFPPITIVILHTQKKIISVSLLIQT